MSNKFERGAEWRKWDLHFHTPASYDYKNKSVTNEDIISVLFENNISVVAITDHHEMDLERIKNLHKLGTPKGITFLPGIEFLSDARGSEPVHFIGIFSEDCSLDYIWGQIKNKTAISRIIGEGKKHNEVYCDFLETTDLVHELGGIVTVHSGQKHGTVETITNSLKHTMAQKEDIALKVDIYELGKADDQGGYREVVFPHIGKVLPMIICSDNHNSKDFQLKANCWIKADPTFEGLKQVVNEPEERVFIGEEPELFQRVASNRTKYIKELIISNIPGYTGVNGTWFSKNKIPINKELVAIIGNKGSGKSAIVDIISLCSNYHNNEDFSFLTKGKFREKNGRIAKNFEATIIWESGPRDAKNLNDDPDDTTLKDVKYIPQGQFNRLTNEISTVKEFQKEIESVVFSHIPTTERLGTLSFSELIEKTTSSASAELETYKNDIKDINKFIIKLERKATISYLSEIENKYKKKDEEFEALIEPTPVSDPNQDPEKKKQNEVVNKKINELKIDIGKLESNIKDTEKTKKETLETLHKLENIKTEILQKETEITRYISEKTEQLSEFDINIEKLISIKTDFTEINIFILSQNDILQKVKEQLGESETTDDFKSLYDQLTEKQKEFKIEKDKLNTEQQQYQDYLTAKESWKKDRDKITGNVESFDTLKYLNKEINYLKNGLTAELEIKYEERREIVRDLFDKRQEVITVYKDARNRLNKIIADNSDTLKGYRIEVDASLAKRAEFNSMFLDFILQNKMGSFHSKDGGEQQLISLLVDIDFDKKEDVLRLLNSIVDALHNDKRVGQGNAAREVSNQVKDIPTLYNYIFSLEFLDNNYQLKQGDKEIQQLSPGERGALLLVFYLLLDKNDIPLIIDQPEDNLDNHSVAKILVPFIKAAKKKRQIIMVTHNPNLAVVADAEQVIYANLDKEKKYTFSTISGSIENKDVNEKIVKVLEGTMPAFNTRKRKYYE